MNSRLMFLMLASLCLSLPVAAGGAGSKSNANTVAPPTPPSEPASPSGGDPVGYMDGSVYDSVEDLRISCPDIDLVFRRSYGSWSTRTGSLGCGWTHSYEWRLEISGEKVLVYSAGEAGATDAVHTFDLPESGSSVFNADGYGLKRSATNSCYSLVSPDALTYAFNSSGRLVSISTWNGTDIAVVRDSPSGKVTKVEHSCGKWMEFIYDENGYLSRVNTPDDEVYVKATVSRYNNAYVLKSVVRYDKMGSSFLKYSYAGAPDPGTRDIYSMTPPAFSSASIKNGGQGNFYSATGTGRSISSSSVINASSSGGGFKSSSSGGVSFSQSVNIVRPSLKKVPEPDTGVPPGGWDRPVTNQSFTVLNLHVTPIRRPVLASKTDANGITTTYEYIRDTDAPSPKCSHSEMTGGLFSTFFTYGSGATTERKPTAWGMAKMTLKYDSKRRETSRTTGKETLSKTYDSQGDMVHERLRNAETGAFVESRMSYGPNHRVVSRGSGFNAAPVRFTTIAWDGRRNIPNRVVTPVGRIHEWKTNGLDVVVYGAGTNDPRNVTHILMTDEERPRAIIAPDGGRTDLAYDNSGYVTNIVSSCLPPVSLGYDALGHVDTVSSPGPYNTVKTMSSVNNSRGMPLSVLHPDGTSESFEYDGNGRRPVRHVDALGREDIYQWVLGKPLHAGRIIDGVTNTLFGVSYDMQLNAIAITDPLGRNAETYMLDENERVVAVTNVEGQVMTRRYAVGDIVSSETRFDGSVVSYGYDRDGNLNMVAYPDDTVRLSHDGDGLCTSASNSAGMVSNGYDSATGWLMSSRGVNGAVVAYVRRNGGGLAAMTTPAGTTSYRHDAADRWTHLESPEASFGFGYCEWNGRLAAVTNGNGLITEYAYDIMDRVTNIAWRTVSGAALGGFGYGYDAIGRIVSRRHTLGNDVFERTYGYDALDCLASDGDTAYAYDAAGNRMSMTDASGTVNYTLGVGDRLAFWTGGSYSHDEAGNVIRIVREGRPTLDLSWNSLYQLVSVSTNGVFAESYVYDALGRRASTTTLDGTVRHVYDVNWQCVADLDGNGNVVASYVWGAGIDRLLAVKVEGASYYPLTDIQGTVWGYVDSQNSIVAQWRYDAWGNAVGGNVSVPALARLRYRFQGREWSAATGLVNFRMRWYDSETGRWLSKDPIGLGGGLNLYAFCGSDPVNDIDLYGLCPTEGNPYPALGSLGPVRKGSSGHGYQADPLGHGRIPGTDIPKEPHIHQNPKRNGPVRKFGLDGTPFDGGPKIPSKDESAFKRAVKDALKYIPKMRMPPIMLLPPVMYLNPREI